MRLRAEMTSRKLSNRRAAREIGCAAGSLQKYLAATRKSPSPMNRKRIRAWLAGRPAREAEVPASVPSRPAVPSHQLTVAERDKLLGHLSLVAEGDLRKEFGASRAVLEQAAAGQELAAEIIGRVRSVMTTGAASSG